MYALPGSELPFSSPAEFSTSSPQQAGDHLGPHLVNHCVRVLGVPQPLSFRHHVATIGGLGFNAVCYGADVSIDVEPLEGAYLLTLLYAGRGELHQGKQVMHASVDTVCVFNPGEASQIYLSADQRNVTVRIPAGVLQRQMPNAPAPLFNSDSNGHVHAGGLRGFVSHMCEQLRAGEGSLQHPLVVRNVEDMLATLMLAEIPLASGSLDAASTPRHVARAEAFMQENYRAPLTLAQIAAACGISMRALQKGYSRHRGTTPMQALLEIRLRAADSALRLRRNAAVTGIAMDCGFTHMGRFAQAYQRYFGKKPSDTRSLKA